MRPGNLGFPLMTHKTDDIDDLHDRLKSADVEIVTPPRAIAGDGEPYRCLLAKGQTRKCLGSRKPCATDEVATATATGNDAAPEINVRRDTIDQLLIGKSGAPNGPPRLVAFGPEPSYQDDDRPPKLLVTILPPHNPIL